VATYIAIEAQRGIRPATIGRRLAAIRYTHTEAGYGSPTDSRHIRDVMAGIRNTHGTAPDRKAPATADRLGAMLACIPADTLTGKRDRAMLALGFSAALRRSELVVLTVDDVESVPEGVRLTIRRSKTDQSGEGYVIAIPDGTNLRPLAALREWIGAAGVTCGPLFRSINKAGRVSTEGLSGRTVANLVKQYAALAGLKAEDFSGHSLRAGFITSAAATGATIWKMQAVSRHKTLDVLSATCGMRRLSRITPARRSCRAGDLTNERQSPAAAPWLARPSRAWRSSRVPPGRLPLARPSGRRPAVHRAMGAGFMVMDFQPDRRSAVPRGGGPHTLPRPSPAAGGSASAGVSGSMLTIHRREPAGRSAGRLERGPGGQAEAGQGVSVITPNSPPPSRPVEESSEQPGYPHPIWGIE
jgi:integrase